MSESHLTGYIFLLLAHTLFLMRYNIQRSNSLSVLISQSVWFQCHVLVYAYHFYIHIACSFVNNDLHFGVYAFKAISDKQWRHHYFALLTPFTAAIVDVTSLSIVINFYYTKRGIFRLWESMTCFLMPWRLTSPAHQHWWYWQYRIAKI